MNLLSDKQLAEVEISYKSKVKPADRVKITSSVAAFQVFKQIFNPNTIEHHEDFIFLILNRANHVIGWHKLSQGGTSGTVVDVKIVFQIAIKANACSIVLAHNHPSGATVPSEDDKTITRKIKEAGKILDIKLLDHLIVTPETYFSFSDEGLT
jgi:DNA repair protein RadC